MTGVDVSENIQLFVYSNRLDIDMKELPLGVYILVIPYGGEYFTHKINKQ